MLRVQARNFKMVALLAVVPSVFGRVMAVSAQAMDGSRAIKVPIWIHLPV